MRLGVTAGDVITGAARALLRVMREKDRHTCDHMLEVQQVALAMGRLLGLESESMEVLDYAALLHDIGKVSVPTEILCKPARLSEIEWGIICLHPQTGAEILGEIPFPNGVPEIVLQHHERCDGSGYPNGLLGNEILPEARILMVADVYCAMSEDRPYRSARPTERIAEEFGVNRAVLYDPDVVDALLEIKPEIRGTKVYSPAW